jgi:hypothetical protein
MGSFDLGGITESIAGSVREEKRISWHHAKFGEDKQVNICSGGTCGHLPDINPAAVRVVSSVGFPVLRT